MKHRDLTGRIIQACYAVANELGHGFVESVYQRALMIALDEAGLAAESEVGLRVHFHGQVVGQFAADIVVEESVVIELKAVRAVRGEHQAQLINYLNASEVDVGLLVNFGTPRPEIKRCVRTGVEVEWSHSSEQAAR